MTPQSQCSYCQIIINKGLAYVEAGAQGKHKIQRGYLPNPTYSAHWIADPNFSDAVKKFLELEGVEIENEIQALQGETPYRK